MEKLCWHVTCNTIVFKTHFLHISQCISSQESSNRLPIIFYFLFQNLQGSEFDSACDPNESKWLGVINSCVQWVSLMSNWAWITNLQVVSKCPRTAISIDAQNLLSRGYIFRLPSFIKQSQNIDSFSLLSFYPSIVW